MIDRSIQKPHSLTGFIMLFVALKLILNLLAAGHYGFHRDELLHLTLGDHLDWGYKEVPPLIAWLAKISTAFFGTAVFAARIFPAIAGALMIWLTGLLAAALGGRRFAVALACLGVVFSPGLAASGYLFQPVVFDQLWWLLATYITVKYINTAQPKYLYWLGVVTGLGLLTKYTMAFFMAALLLGLLLTPQRKLLWRKATIAAVVIALLVFLPNIIWQYLHYWPVVTHMHNLKQEQLDFVKPADFIAQQLLLHGAALLVWLPGLLFLLFYKPLHPYRFLAFAYLLVFIFFIKMNGKAYYLLAGYPMLFAAGGYAAEKLLRSSKVRALTTAITIIPNIMLLPLVLPVLPIKQALALFAYNRHHLPFLDFAVTWEDHKKHATTQDFADMLGWDEMARKAAYTYQGLTPAQQKRTIVYTNNYGQAGAMHIYSKKYKLPPLICLNSSFALWAPDSLNADYMIYVSEDNNASHLLPLADSCVRTGVIENVLAREHSTGIFLISRLKPELNRQYQRKLAKTKIE